MGKYVAGRHHFHSPQLRPCPKSRHTQRILSCAEGWYEELACMMDVLIVKIFSALRVSQFVIEYRVSS
jgi:hypothetical protein